MSDYYKTKTIKKSHIVSKPGIGKRVDSRFLVPNSRITLRKRVFPGLRKKLDYKVSIVNLSRKGLQVLATEALCPGDDFNISLTIPGLTGPMNVKAKVVWCKLYKIKYNEPYYRIGFKFLKLNRETEIQLKQLESGTG